MSNPASKKSVKDMTAAEIVNVKMDLTTPERTLPTKRKLKRPRHSEWAKTNEANLETLARVRHLTQFGGPMIRRCEVIAKSTGQQCGHVALKGEKVCYNHANPNVHARLQARRLEEGRPIDTAVRVALRNVRNVVRQNKLDRDLLLQPVFQSIMRVVAPAWFGKQRTALGKKITRRDIGDAALLAREMVLAWETAKSGDMLPWSACISKARKLGYDGRSTPFD